MNKWKWWPILAAMLLVAIMSVSIFPAEAEAVQTWYLCEVVMAGTFGEDKTMFRLKSDSTDFSVKWFSAKSSRSKEQLAVAMAALLNGMKVTVLTDVSTGDNPEIENIVLTQ
jgi:hypothetical protein